MKRIFWKLHRNGNSYELKNRRTISLIYLILILPITAPIWILYQLRKAMLSPLTVRQSRIKTNNHTRKNRKLIYSRLLHQKPSIKEAIK